MVTRQGRSRSRGPSALPALGALLVLAVPLAAGTGLAVWALARSPLQSSQPSRPVVARVADAERRHDLATTVTFVPAGKLDVSTQSTGTITALSLTPGKAITQGDIALEVDGVPVIAYVSDAPLYRDIGDGTRGRDVRTLQELLMDLEYLDADSEIDGTVGPSTRAAIRAFNKDHGRGSSTTTISPGFLLWVPAGTAAPREVAARVGDAAAPRSVLYTTERGTASVTVATDPSGKDRTLTVGSASVTLPAGETTVSGTDHVATVREAMGEQESTAATLTDFEPGRVGTVPASAVVVDADGRACFFPSATGDPVGIHASDGGFGIVDVDVSLVGTPVLVNPRTVRDDLSCAS